MAKITDLCNGVVALLGSVPALSGKSIERAVFGDFEVERLGAEKIRVWSGQRTVVPFARCGQREKTHGVFVTVSKAVDPANLVAEVDALEEVVETIEAALLTAEVAGLPPKTPDASILDDGQFLSDMLQRKNTYHHVITLAYTELG